MLRTAPTKIRVDFRDLEWHDKRHKHRQKLRNSGQPVDVLGSPVKDQPATGDQNLLSHINRLSPAKPIASKIHPNNDNDLISQEPIPRGRDGNVFWNKFVADAGAPSGIQVQNIDRQPQVIDLPGKTEDIIHSSRASIDENYFSDHPDPSLPLNSHFSPNPGQVDSSEKDFDEKPNLTEARARSGSSSQVSPLCLNGKLPDDTSELISSTDNFNHPPDDQNFDGASDSNLKWRHSGVHGSDGYSNANTSQMIYPNIMAEHETGQMSFPSEESSVGSASPELPSPAPVDLIRHRSGCLPRSSLYISQAAASSSPEKNSQEFQSQVTSDSAPSTCPENCVRSRISSEAVSEAFDSSLQYLRHHKNHEPCTDGLSRDPIDLFPTKKNLFTKDVAQRYQCHSVYVPTRSPEESKGNAMMSSPNLGTYSSGSVPTQEDESQNKEPSPNGSPSPQSTRTFPRYFHGVNAPKTPPRPSSFSLNPSASPFNPSRSSAESLPSSPPPAPPSNLSCPSPTPNRIPVYNDNLPASIQPQTPANIPRSSRYPRSTAAPGVAYTAPAGRNRDAISRWRYFSRISPTRGPRRRGGGHQDQENSVADAEIQRAWERMLRRVEGARGER